ncbi:low affinity immunoglobulin gamma Fc region receptor II-b isoform X3 [Crocuta crocuta]
MQVPSSRPLPVAGSDLAEGVPCPSLGDMLLWTALLFLGPVVGTPALPKAVVALEPPWIHVLQEDNVTLKCQGGHAAGDPSTRWFHNGSAIPAQGRPSYSFQASKDDRGEYTCQTDQTSLSDPVYLDVISEGGAHRPEVPRLEEQASVQDHVLPEWEIQAVFLDEFHLLHPTGKRQPQWQVPLHRANMAVDADVTVCGHHRARVQLERLLSDSGDCGCGCGHCRRGRPGCRRGLAPPQAEADFSQSHQ